MSGRTPHGTVPLAELRPAACPARPQHEVGCPHRDPPDVRFAAERNGQCRPLEEDGGRRGAPVRLQRVVPRPCESHVAKQRDAALRTRHLGQRGACGRHDPHRPLDERGVLRGARRERPRRLVVECRGKCGAAERRGDAHARTLGGTRGTVHHTHLRLRCLKPDGGGA